MVVLYRYMSELLCSQASLFKELKRIIIRSYKRLNEFQTFSHLSRLLIMKLSYS